MHIGSIQIGEGNGTPLQYSCLENPMDGGAWRAAVHGVAEGQTRLSNFTASPGARGTLSAPRGGARSSAGPLEKSRVPRGATGPRRFSTRASSTHPKHTKVPGPGRLGAPPSCVELGEPLDCSHFPGDPRPQKPRRSDPGCAPRGAPGHRTPGLGGSGRGCRRPELGIKRGTYLATG